jgi:hypothetical protein
MQQSTIFDQIKAREAAERGMRQAADNKASLLEFAKGVARDLGRKREFVTADDVQRVLVETHRISDRALGNAAGSLFKGSDWQFAGVTKSTRVSAHGRLIRKWRYVGQ